MKSLFRQKILERKKNILKIFKSLPQAFLKVLIVSVLLFSSINIMPLIPEFNNTNSSKVEAAGAPQWGTPKGTFTREGINRNVTTPITSATERWNKADLATNYGWKTPYIAGNGDVYVMNGNILYAFALDTGIEKWKKTFPTTTPTGGISLTKGYDIMGIAPNGDVVVHGGGDQDGYSWRIIPTGSNEPAIAYTNPDLFIASSNTHYWNATTLDPSGDYVFKGNYLSQNGHLEKVSSSAPYSDINATNPGYKPGQAFNYNWENANYTTSCGGNCWNEATYLPAFSSDNSYLYTSNNKLIFRKNIVNMGYDVTDIAPSQYNYVMNTWFPHINRGAGGFIGAEMTVYGSRLAGVGVGLRFQTWRWDYDNTPMPGMTAIQGLLGSNSCSTCSNYRLYYLKGNIIRVNDVYNYTQLPYTATPAGTNFLDFAMVPNYNYTLSFTGANATIEGRDINLSPVFSKSYSTNGTGKIAIANDGTVVFSTGTRLVALGASILPTCSGVATAAPTVTVANTTSGTMRVTANNLNSTDKVVFYTWSDAWGTGGWAPATGGAQNDIQAYGVAVPPGSTSIFYDIPLTNHVNGNGHGGVNVGNINIHAYLENAKTSGIHPNPADPLFNLCGTTTFYVNQNPKGQIAATCSNLTIDAFDPDDTNNVKSSFTDSLGKKNLKIDIYDGIKTALKTPVVAYPGTQFDAYNDPNFLSTSTNPFLSSHIIPALVSPNLQHRAILSTAPFNIKDGLPHTFYAYIYDTTTNVIVTTINSSSVTCYPDPWFTVSGAQSYSFSGFINTIDAAFSNPNNRPGKPGTLFSDASVFLKNYNNNFNNSSDGVTNVTSYRDRAIKSYKDANYTASSTNRIFTSSSYANLYPKVKTDIKSTVTPPTGFSFSDGSNPGGLTIRLSALTSNNQSYIFTENKNVLIYYDITLAGTHPTGIALYLFNSASVKIKLSQNLSTTSGNTSIFILADSDITVEGSRNAAATAVDYFNMGLVSGIKNDLSGGGKIYYTCFNYTAPETNGCRIEQIGFSYAENKVQISFKNTQDMGLDSSSNKPSLKINYNPNFLNDFTKQLSFYDFTTDFLGFNY